MRHFPFKQVDVFTNVPYRGNPVAVVLDAQGLSGEVMQRIANWTNLSETTFVLPPRQQDADYRVRIFTPQLELPFAGHPTLGTAHALLEAGFITSKNGILKQECDAGLIELTITPSARSNPVISFKLPTPSLSPLGNIRFDEIESILGAPISREHKPKLVNVGPVWTIVQLASAQDVLALRPDLVRMAEFDKLCGSIGIVVFGPWGKNSPTAIEVRAFAPSLGVSEDPVCGSGNGAVAAFIRESSQIQTFGVSYLSAQGSVVGRAGRVCVVIGEDDEIRVGGQSVTCVDGTIAA